MATRSFRRDEGARGTRRRVSHAAADNLKDDDSMEGSLLRELVEENEERHDEEEDLLDEQLRNQPLLDSMRSLVNKERELAGLKLEEKEGEASLWRQKFFELKHELGGSKASLLEQHQQDVTLMEDRAMDGGADDWFVHLGLLFQPYCIHRCVDLYHFDDIYWKYLDGSGYTVYNLQAASRKQGDKPFRILRKQESIDLSNRNMRAWELDGAVSKLKWLRNFTSVNLSNNCLDDDCQQSLKTLMSVRQLRRLDLRANSLGPTAGAAVIESLPQCRNLQVLQLDANMRLASTPGIGGHLANGLRAAIKAGGCKRLCAFTVTLNDFDNKSFLDNARVAIVTGKVASKKKEDGDKTPAPGRSVGRATMATPTKRSRAISAAHPMNAFALVHAFHPRAPGGGLGASPNGGGPRAHATDGISSLGLPYASLHPRTVAEIALYAVPSLTHLDLSYCYVGPAGAAALARALDGSSLDDRTSGNAGGDGGGDHGRGSLSLKSLRLPHNAIGDSGARALGEALARNYCLTSLNLASNCIGPAGGRALAESVAKGHGWGRTEDGREREDGGGNRVAIVSQLDVGGNPLGETASRLLVAAAVEGVGALKILGLDRVTGATVAIRECARQVNEVLDRLTPPEATAAVHRKGADPGGFGVLAAVDEAVSVEPDDATTEDGFVQVYRIRLADSPLLTPSTRSPTVEGVEEFILEIRWQLVPVTRGAGRRPAAAAAAAAATTDVNNQVHRDSRAPWPWRVCRSTDGEPACFIVKQGAGTTESAAPPIGQAALLPADGAGRGEDDLVRVVCSGWSIHDVLKVFVRPGDRSVRCRNLLVRRFQCEGMKDSPSYGVLWADADEAVVDGGASENRQGWWWNEGAPREPTSAEVLQVSYQLSTSMPSPTEGVSDDAAVGIGECSTATSDAESNGSVSGVYRVRQVYVGTGGRICASWQTKIVRDYHSISGPHAREGGGGRTKSGGGRGGGGGGLMRPGKYTWAIVRTRGGDGGGGSGIDFGCDGGGDMPEAAWAAAQTQPPPRVLHKGLVRVGQRITTRPDQGVKGGGDVVGDNVGPETAASTAPPSGACPLASNNGVFPTSATTTRSSATACPWEWHALKADTRGWLPGDILSLWVMIYNDEPGGDGDYKQHSSRVTSSWNDAILASAEARETTTSTTTAAAAGRHSSNTYRVENDIQKSSADAVGRGNTSMTRAMPVVRGFVLRVVDDALEQDIVRRAMSFNHRTCVRGKIGGRKNGAAQGTARVGGGFPSGRVNEGDFCNNDDVRLEFSAVCPMNMAAAGGSWA